MTETRKPLADSSTDSEGKHGMTRGAIRQAPGGGNVEATRVKAPGGGLAGGSSEAAKKIPGNGGITPEERWNMIAVSAYYRAEQRGFIGGSPAEDWTAAEEEIDSLLGGDKS